MSKAAGRLAVVIRDFLLGLALFLMASSVIAAGKGESLATFFCAPAHARSVEVETVAVGTGQFDASEPARPTARETRATTMAILAIVFATMVAINLWFYRHLRRVYASPRPGGWRRGSGPVRVAKPFLHTHM